MFESSRRDRDVKLLEIQATHLDGLNGSYDEQRHAIRVIASLHGVDTAVTIEANFRSGATIRALEEIRAKDANPKDRELIEKSLQTAKRVWLIDSKHESNIYSERTRDFSGTNADDIASAIKDFPVRIVGRIGENAGPNVLAAEVSKETPEILVMHYGSFEGVEVDGATNDPEKLLLFLKNTIRPGYNPALIVYSRHTTETLQNLREEFLRQHSAFTGTFTTVQMRSLVWDEEPPFHRIVEAVRRALQVGELYQRNKPAG